MFVLNIITINRKKHIALMQKDGDLFVTPPKLEIIETIAVKK